MAVLGLRFCARAFSSCGKWGPLFIAVRGPLIIAASRCGAQAPDAQTQQLWLTGLVAPRHVGSSQTRFWTRIPCIGRQILNHCATREAPLIVNVRSQDTDLAYNAEKGTGGRESWLSAAVWILRSNEK